MVLTSTQQSHICAQLNLNQSLWPDETNKWRWWWSKMLMKDLLVVLLGICHRGWYSWDTELVPDTQIPGVQWLQTHITIRFRGFSTPNLWWQNPEQNNGCQQLYMYYLPSESWGNSELGLAVITGQWRGRKWQRHLEESESPLKFIVNTVQVFHFHICTDVDEWITLSICLSCMYGSELMSCASDRCILFCSRSPFVGVELLEHT